MQITTSPSASAATAAAAKAWELSEKKNKNKNLRKKKLFDIAAKLRQCLFVCSASVWRMWCACVCRCVCECVCVQPVPRLPLSCALFWHQVDKTFHSQPKMRNHNPNKRDVKRVGGEEERVSIAGRSPCHAPSHSTVLSCVLSPHEACLIDASRVNLNSVVIKFWLAGGETGREGNVEVGQGAGSVL